MSKSYGFKVKIQVFTDHPDLTPLMEAVERSREGSVEHAIAVAHLFTTFAAVAGTDDGYAKGHRAGSDAGAAPFLEGSWLRRAWTAARS
jgi:hypothetical protein